MMNKMQNHSLDEEGGDTEGLDPRFVWMLSFVKSTYQSLKPEKFKKFISDASTSESVYEFLESSELRLLLFSETGGTLALYQQATSQVKGKELYFVKLNKSPVSMKNFTREILVGDMSTLDTLKHLSSTVQDIYMPLLQNPNNQAKWSDMVKKDVMSSLHSFLANVQIMVGKTDGETCLPLPPESDGSTETGESEDLISGKERIHVLEGCLITWTKQIKSILRQDPETMLNHAESHPGPMAELEFWTFKAKNLNSIFNQLQSENIRKVLQVLDKSKSTYNVPFAKLCKEVFQSREEANENQKFLAPLEPWFQQLESESDFQRLGQVFQPILHTILLIWKKSNFYNVPTRLVVLIRELCNELIRQSCSFLSGQQVFELIEADDTNQAVDMLHQTLRVCAKFKTTYFDYKAKANVECAENPWRIQNNALFVRLDGFLERCHDILEFTQTIVQFNKLAKIEVGGTKGKTLTTSVHQIYADFIDAVQCIQHVSYDIMDIDARAFDDDFYEFRSKIKELERRLTSVVTQSFDDCKAITSHFKLLDSFDDILERPIIKNELEKKHTALIAAFSEDLHAVQQVFLEYKDSPPIAHNLPPFSGALAWCRGLLERIKIPLDKLKHLSRVVLEREDSKEAIKTYTTFVANLSEFQNQTIQTWAKSIESSTQAKLKLPLLRHDAETQLLLVNFDPALIRLLREVKYFLIMGIDIPETALNIYRKAEVFRRQTGNLDLIVNMYNGIQLKLLPVEKPLVKHHLDRIDQILKRGLKSLNWKSHGIDLFLKECMTDVTETNTLLETMKSHLQQIEKLLQNWSQTPLFERRSKPLAVDEFEESQVSMRAAKFALITDGGSVIHKILKETLKKLKVSQGSPDWRAYVDFISTIVIKGLTKCVTSSLQYLSDQIDPVKVDAEALTPILEIELDLYGKEVIFIPDVTHRADKKGLRDIVMAWVEEIFHMASVFHRMDGVEGTYLKEMRENEEVQKILTQIEASLKHNEDQCMTYRKAFTIYEYLWTTDLTRMFADFLQQATTTCENTGASTIRPSMLDLQKFDEKILHYLTLQSNISESKHSVDICFVRINSQPIKQALSTWVTKWVYMFTQYLHDRVVGDLSDLAEFMKTVNKGLDSTVPSGDKDALMDCMTHIRDVRKRMEYTEESFEPLRNIVALLRSHGINLESSYVGSETAAEYLENVPMFWENTVNKTFKKKEVIQPLQNHTVDTIRTDLAKFQQRLQIFLNDFSHQAPFSAQIVLQKSSGSPNATSHDAEVFLINRAYEIMDVLDTHMTKIEMEVEGFNQLEDLFELSISKYEMLEQARNQLRLLKIGWDMTAYVEFTFADWQATLWSDIQTEDLLDEVMRLHDQVRKLPNPMRAWDVFKRLDNRAKNMSVVLPLVHSLHSPAIRERHWKNLMTITRTSFDKSTGFCLEDILKLELHRFVDQVNDLIEVATKEQKIETGLSQIDELWTNMIFDLTPYKDSELHILLPPDEIIESLEEKQMQLQTMAGMGKFVEYFRDKVSFWQHRLGNVEIVLKLLISVQKQWSSLETIFMISEDIRTQLPEETKRFEGIDHQVRDLFHNIKEFPAILDVCAKEGREVSLREMTKDLEKCQKVLNEYLDVKKNIFPRFYFVSNVSLLDILSNGNNPPNIVPHLGDCFDGIKSVDFQSPEPIMIINPEGESQDDLIEKIPTPTVVIKLHSKDGEIVNLEKPFDMTGAVEIWLRNFVGAIQQTLKVSLEGALETAAVWEVEKPREMWLFDYPAQLALLASQILWTEETETALEELENGQEDAVKKYIEVCKNRLNALIKLAVSDLAANDRVKVITLITVDVHSRDVIQTLVSKKVENAMDFTWQSQLRYYWNNTLDEQTDVADESEEKMEPECRRAVSIRICDFKSLYSYEYIGNCGRLVITPLTDRCYVTLTTALRLVLGGAPAGPAGTGKTETTKDLARGMGLQCYVFNCSDQMNYQTMADIFKGLSQTGAWGCFDEFNRIPIEVLSVVATQVKTVLDAITHLAQPMNRSSEYQHLPGGAPPVKVGEFNFLGDTISLTPTCGFFITMNPGYAGRTELPENLKTLFRSCAMIRPDLQPICENMLMAEGFMKARTLSVKFVTLYELCSELLSKQAHYDWGLRAVKSVLRVAGSLKRAEPNVDEEAILMRALRDFNTPKIPHQDMAIFLGLISDLFPSLNLQTKINDELKQICIKVCSSKSLQPEDMFISKVIQYQEILDVRHSIMLLGPAGCGKTTVWQTLADCHNYMESKAKTVYETVNPKSVTSDELYGFMTLSRDWKDGVLSILMRNMSKNCPPYTVNQTGKWVVLDGDIDAVWIESMNTVMDDNKVLTLVSNERIPLTDSMRMIFEINSLKNATPATVSRAGILYMNEKDIGWQPYIDSWILGRKSEKETAILPKLFQKYVDPVYDLLRVHKLQHVVPIPAISHVMSMCSLLTGLLASISESNKTFQVLDVLISFSSMWAFGGALTCEKATDYRKKFSALWKQHISVDDSTKDSRDSGNSIFDYFYNQQSQEVSLWSSIVPEYHPMGEMVFSSIVVPTTESVRLTSLLQTLVTVPKVPVLLVGAAGTGKTTLVKEYLRNMDEDMTSGSINMNYYTDSKSLQFQIEQYVEKRSGRIYGPGNNKKMVYFIDDMNMPFVEEYGTQTPIALMRQYMDYRSWYDRSDLGTKKILHDVQFVGGMNHKSGSFVINPRLQRHFTTFCCTMPSKSDLATIYGTILDIHLSLFPDSIKKISETIVSATLDLHEEVSSGFLPSATKFHYNFNMRELANVFEGLLFSKSEFYLLPIRFIRLWLHECYRVFSDRLISQNEIGRFTEMIVEQSKKHFEDDQDDLHAEPLIFTNFVTFSMDGNPTYMPLSDRDELKKVLLSKLESYNESHPIMNLVLFDQAMDHITRIVRIISNPCGNALLVGVGGSGKQSLSKLSSFICGYKVVQLSVTSNYTVLDLKENLKELYRKAGVKPAVPIVFLLTDSQIIDEKFLVYLNDILNSGFVSDLFTSDEYDVILNSLRNEAKQHGIPDSRGHMLEFFIERVRTNLHVILAFSPVGDLFRIRSRRFPGLINCTCIDWFHPWPKEALVSVALTFLKDVDLRSAAIQENVSHHMAEVHLSVTEASVEYKKRESRYNYVTPTSYLELIQFYKSLLSDTKSNQKRMIDRLDVGLRTLDKTAKDVDALQHDLKATLLKVEEKKRATEELLEKMGRQRSEAEAKQAIADEERKKAEGAAETAQKIEEQASGELRVSKPALDAAKDALNCLSKGSLTELKSMTKPPAGVEKVTTAVLMMVKGETKNFSWDNAKKMMAKVDAFKSTLENYKGETIPAEIVSRVEPILDDPNFTFEKMKSKSLAAANLCVWVINIITFHKVYRKVKPLMDALDGAKQAKVEADNNLQKVEAIVAQVEQQLAELQASFREATNEKAKVEAEAAQCQERLSLAERLVNGLASENERWGKEIDQLRAKDITLVGDVLLSAAFVSYIGAFGMTFRDFLWRERWLADLVNREIPTTADVDPVQILTTDSNIATWMNQELPADRMSIENGCIITSCQRWPLMIDPQLQGLKWLRNRLGGQSSSSLLVLETTQKGWIKKVIHAIAEGYPVIIENLGESIDATLEPLLGRLVYRKGRNLFLKMAGEEISYDENFKLFLQTKLANPHYKPEIAAQCTLINFIVTEKGLEDQLLASVVNLEQPDLEAQKQELQQAFNQYKIQLLELENQLLERLANAPDDILSDVPLIEGLEATKKTADEINLAVERGKETEEIINTAREVYRPVAAEGSMLYFLLAQLCRMNPMYQYSLAAFTNCFFKAMEKTSCESCDNQELRAHALRESLRSTIVTLVSRGLFEDHKLIFLTQLTFNLMQRKIIGLDSGFSTEYMNFLLRGPKIGGQDNTIDWLSDSQWQSLQALIGLDCFDRFISDLEESEARFKEWYNCDTPELEKLPLDWRELDKTPFLKLLVIRCMRPDRVTTAITQFIISTVPNGQSYVTCDADLNSYQILMSSFEDSSPVTPIYFILSPGTDVVADVDKLALKFGMQKGLSYHNIALGQGQDVVAMSKLEQGHVQGHWILLNNVHLMPKWLVTLEKQLDEFQASKSHVNFRVFVSSDPSSAIPIGLLDRSIKLTNEPPTGVKANLRRALSNFTASEIDEIEPRTRSIMFGLCYFHAIMLERKKFGPQGFNMMYPFANGDLRSSAVVLKNYMENAPSKVPWADLRYLFGEIMYGGHIVNDFDRLVCKTYLDYFLRDELLDELQLYPYIDSGTSHLSFAAPKSSSTLDRMLEHVDTEMHSNTTLAFGLHPNAEIAFKTEGGDQLLRTLLDLDPQDAKIGESGDSVQLVAEELLQDVLENFRETRFEIDEIDEDRGPFQNVFVQECQRMNDLLEEMTRSLVELDLGFRGDLTMTDAMDKMTESLFLDRVPDSWMKLAYPSLRPLASWLLDLQARISQLQDWISNPLEIPRVTWISGLFNPQSFLTAIMQSTSQKNKMELDKLVVVTEITKRSVESIDAPSRDGQYIYGLALEGARWDSTASIIVSSQPKEMFCLMPVINCRAVLADRKEQSNTFNCPVYKTQQRGPTYVFTAQLRTKAPAAKWVLAGAVLIMEIV